MSQLDMRIATLRAIAKRDAKIHALHSKKWAVRKIAAEVGVSFQRVAQILNRMEKVSK